MLRRQDKERVQRKLSHISKSTYKQSEKCEFTFSPRTKKIKTVILKI